MFNIAKLAPLLFFDSIVDDVQDPRTSRINLAQMNIRIIDCHRNWNIASKEAIKIKEKKPILNTGLKAYKELKLFWTDCDNSGRWSNLGQSTKIQKTIFIVTKCLNSKFSKFKKINELYMIYGNCMSYVNYMNYVNYMSYLFS